MSKHPHLRAIGLRAAIVALVGCCVLAIGVLVLHQLGFDVERRLWLAKVQLLGREPVGIWRADERLGWSHIPGASGRQREVPDFDVSYHIDADGRRDTPGAPTGARGAVLFLGGSFTFGHGVEDAEPYPALLQQYWPERECINAGVNAWGTTQALLKLQDELATGRQYDLVVYGFIGHHISRNYVRRDWLEILQGGRGRRNPWFELEDERLVFQGLADPARDGRAGTAALRVRELEITRRLLSEMSALCKSHSVRFTVVHLADGNANVDGALLTEPLGAQQVIDLRPELPFDEMRFEHNGHYTAAGHRLVAEALRERLSALLP